ncbi:hypothetical protein [Neolewinella agarilytica]|uniref:hypothetical protein n=1 Tax=Neolewinella agarilytica TaxID=478744 RepID=UPI0011135057|nr:hypothetical protein [Neolewinella agarilytica]
MKRYFSFMTILLCLSIFLSPTNVVASSSGGSGASEAGGGLYYWNEGQDECWGTVWACAKVESDE